jgi:multicomponent Na+:H+ antiporter subunit E
MTRTERVWLLVASDPPDAERVWTAAGSSGAPDVDRLVVVLPALATLDRRPAWGVDAEVEVVWLPSVDVASIRETAEERGAARILLGAAVDVDPDRLAREASVPVESGPGLDPDAGRALRHRRGARRFAGVAVLSFAFYLYLGDPFDPFDLVTGAISAGFVALALASTVFEEAPTARRTPARLLRSVLFLPYLLYEVVRANVDVARVILDPSLPIEPRLVELDPGTDDRLHRAVLANAITLTPGSLTVDVTDDALVVHTLTASSRRGLESGSLQRAVDFVFDGRRR